MDQDAQDVLREAKTLTILARDAVSSIQDLRDEIVGTIPDDYVSPYNGGVEF